MDAGVRRALVLMHDGAEVGWPFSTLEEVAVAEAWDRAPAAALQVIDEVSLTDERVMDAARSLAGTQVYWEKAACVELLDGLPRRLPVRAPPQSASAHRVLVLEFPVFEEADDEMASDE
ncbi:MAG: hypothetical protein SFW67_23745 [Myxococcaceae bacterium]|nr:hypothetical protein [Myxococcaceae bacterium]